MIIVGVRVVGWGERDGIEFDCVFKQCEGPLGGGSLRFKKRPPDGGRVIGRPAERAIKMRVGGIRAVDIGGGSVSTPEGDSGLSYLLDTRTGSIILESLKFNLSRR